MRSILPVLLTFILFSACGKDEPKQPTKTDYISSQKWKYDNGGVDANLDGTIDFNFPPGTLPACVLDNEASFSANGTGIADEGAVKCDAAAPQTLPFNWSFSNNETVLNITGPGLFGLSGQFDILELNATKFTLAKDTTVSGFPQTVQLIVSLKH